jgi:hypothetical protein
MKTTFHIYKIEGEITDEMVDKNFTQRFAHLYNEDENVTYLVRATDYIGEKLDTITEEEIIQAMKETASEEDRDKVGKFLEGK